MRERAGGLFQHLLEEYLMILDQRNDDQPIRSGNSPVVGGLLKDLSDLLADDEVEEETSKWILSHQLFCGRRSCDTVGWGHSGQRWND